MTFLIQQTLLYAIPLMIVALAGVFAERSGIINLALEGIMIFGAFVGVLFVNLMQQAEVFSAAKEAGNWVALQGFELLAMLVAAVLGAIFSLLLSFASVNPAGGSDHWRHSPEPSGSCPGALPHPDYCKPEHPADGGGRCGQLVYDQKEYAGLRPQ